MDHIGMEAKEKENAEKNSRERNSEVGVEKVKMLGLY